MATNGVTASGQNGSNGSSRHLGVLRFPRRQDFKTILSVSSLFHYSVVASATAPMDLHMHAK